MPAVGFTTRSKKLAEISADQIVAVVVTHDSACVLADCLRAIADAQIPFIVVDNASADGSAEVAAAHGARVIAAGRNEGYGRANNIGIKAAETFGWCLIVNPDVIIEKGLPVAMMRAAQHNADAGMIVPRILETDGSQFDHETSLLSPLAPPIQIQPAAHPREAGRIVSFASGACLLVRRDVFIEMGGFDPQIFLYYEDDDWCLRLRREGWTIVQADGATVWHDKGKSSSSKRGRVYLSRFHQAWSRHYIARKHGLPSGSLRFLAIQSLKLCGATCLFNARRVERYAGSIAGTLAALRGKQAF